MILCTILIWIFLMVSSLTAVPYISVPPITNFIEGYDKKYTLNCTHDSHSSLLAVEWFYIDKIDLTRHPVFTIDRTGHGTAFSHFTGRASAIPPASVLLHSVNPSTDNGIYECAITFEDDYLQPNRTRVKVGAIPHNKTGTGPTIGDNCDDLELSKFNITFICQITALTMVYTWHVNKNAAPGQLNKMYYFDHSLVDNKPGGLIRPCDSSVSVGCEVFLETHPELGTFSGPSWNCNFQDSTNGGSNGWMIVGITFILAFIIVLVCCCRLCVGKCKKVEYSA